MIVLLEGVIPKPCVWGMALTFGRALGSGIMVGLGIWDVSRRDANEDGPPVALGWRVCATAPGTSWWPWGQCTRASGQALPPGQMSGGGYFQGCLGKRPTCLLSRPFQKACSSTISQCNRHLSALLTPRVTHDAFIPKLQQWKEGLSVTAPGLKVTQELGAGRAIIHHQVPTCLPLVV